MVYSRSKVLAILFVGFHHCTFHNLFLTFVAMGNIPSVDNMISAVIVSPKNLEDVTAGADINFQVQITNLIAG